MAITTDQLHKLLQTHFGFADFRPGQLPTLTAVLNGEPTLAVLPTGAGKSLLYQLPRYVIQAPIVIVSPLISLMQDQVNRIREHGHGRAVMLNSTLTYQEQQLVLQHLREYQFIFISPETLVKPKILTALKRQGIGLVVIDEAHCISQWGPNFRPEYLLLKDVLQQLNPPRLLMLTATAPPKVRTDILARLGLVETQVTQIVESVNRPNIFFAVEKVADEATKQQRLLALVKELGGQGIIYFSSRQLANEMATALQAATELQVSSYHAGLDALERYRIQQHFMRDQLDVICATSAFGMGIDKDNIRYVIHYHLPKSLDDYVQEVGRAGRNGQPSVAILLNAPGDELLPQSLNQIEIPPVPILEQVQARQLPASALGEQREILQFYLTHGIAPSELAAFLAPHQAELAQQLQWMQSYLQVQGCRRQLIWRYFGETGASQARCCDGCQPAWTPATLDLPAWEVPNREQNPLAWEKRLKQFFN
ncbi:RecQ family ATP-dependent DNA helicase [Limosilactobacillus equigenerosi]|uniref:ATP-dependent DNA helicase RecQ n=1 Tax=Limosilactobacillus equigenerosi DSM 18793 = JCM 14505 TaxID=1423742 RepID=A0A0R1UI80_9LACO|nr:RecQ family ATP-dependent DNA helicase [Limosilactobacillus equigenerosi]KRL92989.1 DNA helicase [Limosilactobacillus equigenerosi DSM 18793 = JCM 14505]